MPKRITISAAMDIADHYDCRQVIVVAWDGERTHVVTYGRTAEECDQASQGADRVKRALNWPHELLGEEPLRVQGLRDEVRELKERIRVLEDRRSGDFPGKDV